MGGREQVRTGFGPQLLWSESNSVNEMSVSIPINPKPARNGNLYSAQKTFFSVLRGMGQISILLTHKVFE